MHNKSNILYSYKIDFIFRMTSLELSKREIISQNNVKKESSTLSWQPSTGSLKGQVSTGDSSFATQYHEKNAVTARADTAENICSCKKALAVSEGHFGIIVGTVISQQRSKWIARQESCLLNPEVVTCRVTVNCTNCGF